MHVFLDFVQSTGADPSNPRRSATLCRRPGWSSGGAGWLPRMAGAAAANDPPWELQALVVGERAKRLG